MRSPTRRRRRSDQLVATYPKSHYIDEAQFRRGELLFSSKAYPKAQSAYEAVINIGASSAFYNQSLYKHGWSLFKQGENERSLDSFAGVLDSMLVSKRDPSELIELETLSRPNRELVEDTFRVMSITFSYLDGPKTIDDFVKRHTPPGRLPRPYSYLLYARLGDLYMEKERYTDAADSYRAFVSQDRNNEKAPLLEMQAIEAYQKGGFPQLVLQGKKEFVENYSFGTAFWQGRDAKSEPKVVAVLKTNLKDVAQYYHAQAQRSKNVADYQEAAKWYRSYLTSFPDDPDSAVTNFLLADTLFESKQYLDAAKEYESTAYHYGDHDKAAAAGYAAIIAYGKQEETLSGDAKTAVHNRALDSSLEIRPDLSRPSGKRAGADAGRHGPVYGQGLSPGDCRGRGLVGAPAAGGHSQAAGGLDGDRQFEFRAGRVRQGGNRLRPRADADARQRPGACGDRRAPGRLDLQAGRAEAQSRRQCGGGGGLPARGGAGADLEGSLERGFRRGGAAHQGQAMGSGGGRIGGFSPQFSAKPAAGRRHAQSRGGLHGIESSWPQPPRSSRKSHRRPGEGPDVQREATLQAADLYDKAGNSAKSRAMLEAFVKHFPQPVDPAMEARNKLSTIAAKAGDTAARDYWLRDIVAADRAAGAARTDRSRALAAKATLTLAIPVREEFMRIKLVVPLKKSLAEKRKAMEAALKAYEQAADYQVADVTTAATFESAELYRQLGKDLDEFGAAKESIQGRIGAVRRVAGGAGLPVRGEGDQIARSQRGARAKDGTYDEWVQKSFGALAQLNPGRYGKVEIGEQQVESIGAAAAAACARHPRRAAQARRRLPAHGGSRAAMRPLSTAARCPGACGPAIRAGSAAHEIRAQHRRGTGIQRTGRRVSAIGGAAAELGVAVPARFAPAGGRGHLQGGAGARARQRGCRQRARHRRAQTRQIHGSRSRLSAYDSR